MMFNVQVAYGIMDGGSTDFYLQRMKDPISKRLYSTINANEKGSKVSDVREGVARVRSSAGEFAFIMEGNCFIISSLSILMILLICSFVLKVAAVSLL